MAYEGFHYNPDGSKNHISTEQITDIQNDEYFFNHDYVKHVLKTTIKMTFDNYFGKVPKAQIKSENQEINQSRKIYKGKFEDLVMRPDYNSLGNPEVMKYISESIFKDERMISTIFSIRSRFYLLLDIPEKQKESFFTKVLSFIYIEDHDRSIIPLSILRRITPNNKDVTLEVLKENDFLVPLILSSLYFDNHEVYDL